MTQPQTIQDDEDNVTTPTGLARYAFEYIEAALLIDEDAATKAPGNAISPTPAYYLAHHGIELTFKAYLKQKGVKAKEIRSYAHSLERCNKEAKKRGLREIFTETADDRDALRMLSALNDYQSLRYIRTGVKQYPLWSIVAPLAVRLHQAVAPMAGYKTFTSVYSAFHSTEPPEL